MNSALFDAYATVKRLTDAGVSTEAALAEAMQQARVGELGLLLTRLKRAWKLMYASFAMSGSCGMSVKNYRWSRVRGCPGGPTLQ